MGAAAIALDIAILSESGEPEVSVPVRVDAHARLMRILDEGDFPLLSRLREYYEDAEYERSELDALSAELHGVASEARSDNELARLIERLSDLVLSAKRSGRQVVAIAD